MPPPLLIIVGTDRDDKVAVQGSRIKLAGTSDLHQLLDRRTPYDLLRITPHMLRQQRRPDLASYRCILNLITEAEQNSRVLEILRKLLRGIPSKVINRPEAITRSTRDQTARRLSGIDGLLVPNIIRLRSAKPAIAAPTIERAGLKFPVILREAGTHTGIIVGCFDRLDDLLAELRPGTEYIATEFVDFRSADGLYRKHRVWFFGQSQVFRHKLISDHWNVHGKDRARFMTDRPELIAEEIALMADKEGAFPPEVRSVLTAVRERMDLDFFGIDFGLAPDGRVVLFEANATMNFFSTLPGREFDYLQNCLPPARAAFRKLLGVEEFPTTTAMIGGTAGAV